MLEIFKWSFVVTAVSGALAFLWAGPLGLGIALILGILEVSLSFDNAVVNATVLQNMEIKWQRRFLTWGMVVAVFGMRLVFPIAIVAAVSGLNVMQVTNLALTQPDVYSAHLTQSHVTISAFGGMFLLMVFFSFLFDHKRNVHWLQFLERKLSLAGRLESIEIILAMLTLLVAQHYLPADDRLQVMLAGSAGIVLYVLIQSLSNLLGGEHSEVGEAMAHEVKRSGVMAFLYLEVLDASFSLDGVIGAFAITKDVVIIALGLMVGAMFVRSLTIYLVHKGTLQEYIFLEHGAHYGIGSLALLMLVSMRLHVPELITGLCGLTFIVLSVISSIRHNRREALKAPQESSHSALPVD